MPILIRETIKKFGYHPFKLLEKRKYTAKPIIFRCDYCRKKGIRGGGYVTNYYLKASAKKIICTDIDCRQKKIQAGCKLNLGVKFPS